MIEKIFSIWAGILIFGIIAYICNILEIVILYKMIGLLIAIITGIIGGILYYKL